MNQYKIKMTDGAVDWDTIPVLNINNAYFETPDTTRAFAQIAAGPEALFVHLWTTEKETRAEETGLFGMPCNDSCLEFFFCPIENDSRYFNIEFNANGCMFLGTGSCINDLVRLTSVEVPIPIEPKIKTIENGWEIFYTVPYEFIRRFFPEFKVFDGRSMRANCYKCTGAATPPEYLSWNPITGEPFRFHRPECYGEMIFIK